MTELEVETENSVWETGRGGRACLRHTLRRFARWHSIRRRARLRGRVLRRALGLQRLGLENSIGTDFAIGQGLRFVFERVGRSFGACVIHRQSLVLLHQHELHVRSVTLDRTGFHVSRNPQPLRVRSRAHGMQFFDGDVITLTVLHPGIGEIAEQHDNQHRDGPELQICISLARHDDRSRGTLPHVRTVRAAEAGIKIRENREREPTKRLTSPRNAPTLCPYLRAFAVAVLFHLGESTRTVGTQETSVAEATAMAVTEHNSLADLYPDTPCFSSRRSFLKSSAAVTAGFSTLIGALALPETAQASDPSPNVLGPRPGYSPQVGTFVSLLTWMREQNGVIRATKGLTQADLDYPPDPNANTIGALMLPLAAPDTYYRLHTFEDKKWGSWPDSVKQQWDAAMSLGDAGRKTIKGHDRDYYLNILQETRAKTLAEFSKRDDTWLMAIDKDWPWGPTNNLCKWFHVCEHEAHHTGQIAFLKKRLPGAKPDTE